MPKPSKHTIINLAEGEVATATFAEGVMEAGEVLFVKDYKVLRGLAMGLRPVRRLMVSEWAEAYRVLGQGVSKASGKWRNSRTPYLVAPMDALSVNISYKRVVMMTGAQVGKSSVGENFIGYAMSIDPANTLLLLATTDMAKDVSQRRIQPMIDESPILRDLVAPMKSRNAGNTILRKQAPGMVLKIGGANSLSFLKSINARYGHADEINEYKADLKNQGDAVALFGNRFATYSSTTKQLYTSTAGVKGASPIGTMFEDTDQNFYHVPCPHCVPDAEITYNRPFEELFATEEIQGYQVLVIDNFKMPKGPASIYYECKWCQKEIHNHHKDWFLPRGYWIARKPENRNPDVIGFHLASFYSPAEFFSWHSMAIEYELALKYKEKWKEFVQSKMGEDFEEEGDQPPHDKLYQRGQASHYTINDPLPDGVCLLTCGIDVQKDRIELEVVGYGRDRRKWSIDYQVILGDINSEPELLNSVARVINGHYRRSDTEDNGEVLPIAMTFMDSGYAEQKVYAFCMRMGYHRCMPIKGGAQTMRVPLSPPSTVYLKKDGKKSQALKLINVNGAYYKEQIYSDLRGEIMEDKETGKAVVPAGYCYFPRDYQERHYKNLTNEKRVLVENKKGYAMYEWRKMGRNEQLDCRVYAEGAATLIQVDRYMDADWDRMAPSSKRQEARGKNQDKSYASAQSEESLPKEVKKKRSNLPPLADLGKL